MTDKVQKIREGIERLKSQLIKGACASQIAMETHCKEEAYNEVLAILDAEQEEPVSDDLEDAAIQICQKVLKGETIVIDGYEYVVLSDAEECFKAGARWQKQKDSIVSEDLKEAMQHNAPDNIGIDDLLYWRNGFITGAQWQKEQMMSKAVDALVHTFDNGYIRVGTQLLANNKYGLKVGDKLKLIIVKED